MQLVTLHTSLFSFKIQLFRNVGTLTAMLLQLSS